MKRLDEIFGNGSGQEMEKAAVDGKIVERIEELSREKHNWKNGREREESPNAD